MNPTDDNDQTNPQAPVQPATENTAPAAGEPVQTDMPGEKCATCTGPAAAGNCTNCGQNQYGCTCPAPTPSGGEQNPPAPAV